MWNLKNNTNKTIYNRNGLTDIEKLMVKGKRGRLRVRD